MTNKLKVEEGLSVIFRKLQTAQTDGKQIRMSHSPDELLHAIMMSLRAEGRSVEAKVVQSLTHDSGQRPYTADEALALLLDAL